MKMRRLISLIMAIMVLTTLCMPMSHATEPEYLEYTITFDNVSIMPLSEPFENNVQAAKDYVQSLSLDEYGFGYIEDACLQQLDSMVDMDVPLESYTVYIPKTRASDPTYIGTRNSVDFYYGKYSSYSVATESEEINSRTLLQTWATGAANLILCFGPLEYTIPFTVIAAAIGSFPSNTYIVGEGDFFLYYHRVEANCYGVYSKSGSDYRMWLSLENGTIRPYTVYHYSGGSVSHNCDAKVAETDSYGDTNKQLIKAAAMYAEGVSAFYERLTALTQYYARE